MKHSTQDARGRGIRGRRGPRPGRLFGRRFAERRRLGRRAHPGQRFSSNGWRRRSSPAITPPRRRATTRRRGWTSTIQEAGGRHGADRSCSPPATPTSRSRGSSKVLGSSSRAPTSPTSPRSSSKGRHDRRSPSRTKGHHGARGLQGQERSAAGATGTSGSCSPAAEGRRRTARDVTLVHQAFDMNGFLTRATSMRPRR